MTSFKKSAVLLVLLASAGLLAGCPFFAALPPGISVSPTAVSFGATAVERNIIIRNTGGGTLTWSLEITPHPTTPAVVPDWLTPARTTGATGAESELVELFANRTGLLPGTYRAQIVITSNGSLTPQLITVVLEVQGSPDLDVTPTQLNLFGSQTKTSFTISNDGDGPLEWSLVFESPANPGVPISQPAFLTISPRASTTLPGQTSTVSLEIDRNQINPGLTTVHIIVVSTAGNVLVTLNIGSGVGARIGVDQTVLNFGTSTDVLTFNVFNAGETGSGLEFTLSTDRPDLIAFAPAGGTSAGVPENTPFNLVPITVTIDRNALRSQTDGGVITVSSPGLDSVTVLVTTTEAPLAFEGAQARTRRPFIARFVFTLRDGRGRTIDTNNPVVFDEITRNFAVFEDGIPLDLNETSFFLSSARNLRNNLALLLDYTGSMFNSGDGAGANIELMVKAARAFIADVPSSYAVALMEYHERQQTNRLIHGFSSDREPIIAALDAFSLPAAEHGASEIHDALIDGIARLALEDAAFLSFDDADVRALVFITDGKDTSSVATSSEVIDAALQFRVRLFPIGFGADVRSAPLIAMATATGGHYYQAATGAELSNVLENEIVFGSNAPGLLAKDLSRQIVATLINLPAEDQHLYTLQTDFNNRRGSVSQTVEVPKGGDIRAGQIALRTSGIQSNGRAEVFVRADYVPRNITQLRFRFITDQAFTIELAPEGIIEDWILIDEGGGVFTALTTDENFLTFGAFGNLLKLTFDGLTGVPFTLGFRVDNRILVNPPFTKFFQYPDILTVSIEPNQASVIPISQGFDPDAPGAFDRDGDLIDDFDDPFPDVGAEPPNAPSVRGVTPTADTTPTWTWRPGGGGNGVFRFQLDSEAGEWSPETSATSFTPAQPLSLGDHTLFVQERNGAGNWSESGSFTITIQP